MHNVDNTEPQLVNTNCNKLVITHIIVLLKKAKLCSIQSIRKEFMEAILVRISPLSVVYTLHTMLGSQ